MFFVWLVDIHCLTIDCLAFIESVDDDSDDDDVVVVVDDVDVDDDDD